jgi:hypothetical protein
VPGGEEARLPPHGGTMREPGHRVRHVSTPGVAARPGAHRHVALTRRV